jgi:hypothetical protein
MAKSASALAFALLVATIGPASASNFEPDCLQQIDDLIVEYDLPASAAFAGTQTATSQAPLPGIPKQGGRPAADLPHTPAGRPGAALLEHEGVQPQPTLPPERQLPPAKRAEVQASGTARRMRGGCRRRQCEMPRRLAPGPSARREEGLRRESWPPHGSRSGRPHS